MVLRVFLFSWFLAGTLGQNTTTGPQESTTFSAQPASTKATIDKKSTTASSVPVAAVVDDGEVTDANDFVDQILEEVQTSEAIQAKLTPALLGDLQYNGFTLSDAKLHGVNSVYRSDNCTFRFTSTSFDVLVHLGAKNLGIESGWSRTWLFIPLKGHLEAKVEDVSILMDINVNKGGVPSLSRLKVVRLSDIHITKATGASFLLNWALRGILNWVVKANKGKIIQLVETSGAMAIDTAMRDLGSKLTSLNEFRRRR